MRLLDWLAYLSDQYQPGYYSGILDIRARKRECKHLSPNNPLPKEVWDRLNDPEADLCQQILQDAVEHLKHKHRSLFERLIPVYFADDPNPRLVERWRKEAPSSPAARRALADHKEAINILLTYVEQELSRYRLKRLIVNVPHLSNSSESSRSSSAALKREEALEIFCRYLELEKRFVAVRRTAERTGFSLKEVRRIAGEVGL